MNYSHTHSVLTRRCNSKPHGMSLSVHVLLITIAYVSTTIDNFMVLFLYFGRIRTKPHLRGSVALGYLMGFSCLCAISLLGTLFQLIISIRCIKLLGFIPLCIGIYGYYKLCISLNHPTKDDNVLKEKVVDASTIGGDIESPTSPTPLTMDACSCLESHESTECCSSPPSSTRDVLLSTSSESACTHDDDPPSKWMMEIMCMIIANGGDNIVTYIPLFLSLSRLEIVLTLFLFTTYSGLWILLSYYTVNHGITLPIWYTDRIIPALLIVIAVYILSGSILGLYVTKAM